MDEVCGAAEGESIVGGLLREGSKELDRLSMREGVWSKRRKSPWMVDKMARKKADKIAGRKAPCLSSAAYASRFFRTLLLAASLSSISGSA